MQLGKYFTLSEMTNSAIARSHKLNNIPSAAELEHLKNLVKHILDPLREALGPVTVTSGFRSAPVNRAAGGSSSSQHVLGQAADIKIKGMTSDQVVRKIIEMKLPFDQVIEEFGSWVHVSYGPRHRRQALRARTVKGTAQYVAFA